MAVKVEIRGLKETQAYIKAKEKDFKAGVVNALDIIGAFMEGEVKQSIAGNRDEHRSVDTGRLLSSISYNAGETSTVVYTDVEYADEIEYGTTRIAPRRHFENSLARNRPKIKSYFEEELKKKE